MDGLEEVDELDELELDVDGLDDVLEELELVEGELDVEELELDVDGLEDVDELVDELEDVDDDVDELELLVDGLEDVDDELDDVLVVEVVDVDEDVVVVVTPEIEICPLPWKLIVTEATPSTASLILRLVTIISPV